METRSPEAQLAARSPQMSPMSPMTPSTPPYRIRSLAGMADHRRRLTDYGADGDTTMHSRVSMDSTASTVVGEEKEADERDYAWTEEQVAVLVRTLEDGCPPNVKQRTAPRTPYNAAQPPNTLIDLWARQLKRYRDWPHDVREIRRMLKLLAGDVAKGIQPGRRPSPNADADALMDYEETRDETGLGDLLHSPPSTRPRASKMPEILKSSIRLQRLDRDLDIQPVNYHPYLHARPRSPLKTPRSSSGEPISPTDSYFPGSPSYKSTSSIDKPRSRSVSPSGSDGPRPSTPIDSSRYTEPLSLSPMKLSPRKAGRGTGGRAARSPDPTDMLAAFSSEAGGSKASGRRAPIPSSFFYKPAPSMLQPAAQLQGETFFTSNAPMPSHSNQGKFSSVSSVSSLFSTQSSAGGSPTRPSHSPSKRRAVPYLPPLSVMPPHLASEAHASRGGIKRSASFSRPADPIKRAPSYPSIKESSKLRLTRSPPETNIVPEEPTSLLGHKRVRSESSFAETEYDTEDAPPSSAPSSDVIPPVSPLKVPFNSSLSKSPRKSGPHKLLQSPSMLLPSPRFLPGRLFSRKKGVRAKSTESSDVERDRTTSTSPTPSPFPRVGDRDVTLSPVSPSTPGRHGMDLDRLLLSPDSSRTRSERESSVLSHSSTPRSRVTSTPRPPTARHKASAELKAGRQSPGERGDGEPRRKRIKTDELTTPPRSLHTLSPQNGYEDHSLETPRPASRALSDTGRRTARTPPQRVRATALSASRTPPRKGTKSPRLLSGGGRPRMSSPPVPVRPANPLPTLRLTASPPPLNNMAKIVASLPPVDHEDEEARRAAARQRIRSGMASATAAGSGGASSNSAAAKEGRDPSTRGTQRPASPTEKSRARRNMAETITKARSPVPERTSNKIGMSATVGRTAGRIIPKRQPSFLGPELVLKHPVVQEPMDDAAIANRLRHIGTAVSTTSISSVLFPGGRSDLPPTQLDPVPEATPTTGNISTGEQGISRPGEPAVQTRRQTPNRDTVRSSVGFGRARMTRSISMIGPGEKPQPY